jgi:ubiquinone/menaquinone biosynthesis C-methylase UbiE
MEDEYKKLAKSYDKQFEDKLTRSMYREWKTELEKAIKKYKIKVNKLADLGCGTGITTIPWLKKGYKIIGVEVSKQMINEARKKSSKINWINQDLISLDIKEKVDVATCHFDVLNHILRKNDLLKVFKNIYNILNKGGLFIFDMMSPESFIWLKEQKIKSLITQRAYQKDDIKKMLKKSGFEILKISKQKTPEWDGKPNRIIYLVRRVK